MKMKEIKPEGSADGGVIRYTFLLWRSNVGLSPVSKQEEKGLCDYHHIILKLFTSAD